MKILKLITINSTIKVSYYIDGDSSMCDGAIIYSSNMNWYFNWAVLHRSLSPFLEVPIHDGVLLTH